MTIRRKLQYYKGVINGRVAILFLMSQPGTQRNFIGYRSPFEKYGILCRETNSDHQLRAGIHESIRYLTEHPLFKRQSSVWKTIRYGEGCPNK
jgi:hypothetical protein